MAKRTAKLFPAVFPACLQLFCRPVIMAGGGRNEIGAEIAGAIHINESGHPGDSCLFSNELLWNFFGAYLMLSSFFQMLYNKNEGVFKGIFV